MGAELAAMMRPALSSTASPPFAPDRAERLARRLQTLGNPARLRILSALEMVCVPVSAIVAATGLAQPTVSHHLRILADRGVVRGARQGSRIYYCLSDETVMAAVRRLQALTEEREGRRPSAPASPAASGRGPQRRGPRSADGRRPVRG